MLLGDGSVQECSKGQCADLFHALSGSYGSLAILLQAKIQLQPAGPYVRVHYSLALGSAAAISQLQAASRPAAPAARPEFVEALQLPPHPDPSAPLLSLIMTADFVADTQGKAVRRFSRHWGVWYFEHASRIARRLQRSPDPAHASEQDFIPTIDYLFRYDYGAFWMARPLQPWSRHTAWTPVLPMMFALSSPLLLVRMCIGWLFATKRLFSLLKKAPPAAIASRMIILDAYVPAANVGHHPCPSSC